MELEKEAYIFGSIFITSNMLQVIGDKLDPNITIKQWLFIAAIMKSQSTSPTITEVAKFIGYSRQNVKKTAIVLEKKGFLTLTKDTTDERAIKIVLTDQCKDYFSKRNNMEVDFIKKLFYGFDENQLKGLFNGLKKLENNIKSMENENER